MSLTVSTMKKRMMVALLILTIGLSLSACCLPHEWQEAACATPKTCTKCGKTDGTVLGHSWEEASCASPRTCSRCGKTEGSALEHDWGEWTETVAATTSKEGKRERVCNACGEKEEESTDKLHSGFNLTVKEFVEAFNKAYSPADITMEHYLDRGDRTIYYICLEGQRAQQISLDTIEDSATNMEDRRFYMLSVNLSQNGATNLNETDMKKALIYGTWCGEILHPKFKQRDFFDYATVVAGERTHLEYVYNLTGVEFRFDAEVVNTGALKLVICIFEIEAA